jgi:hypothetical protein
MASRRPGPVVPSELSPADLALCVHGPWHPAAAVDETAQGVLWHPRCDAVRLEALLVAHGPAIRAAATAAGVKEPWIVGRCRFTRMLDTGVWDDDLK